MQQPTRIANRYAVIDKLGQGGMGAVWHVYDRLEKIEVALTVIIVCYFLVKIMP